MQNRVAQLRREQNMRQEELARAVGISRQSIIAIEKGHSVPSLETALRIARCFAVPVEAVFLPDERTWLLRPESDGACPPIAAQGDPTLSGLTYGGYPLRYNGGEVIAAYNAMSLLGRGQALAEVIREFEDNGLPLLGGVLGTDPRRLPEYFAAHGIACVPCKKDALAPGVYLCSYTAVSLLKEVRGLHTAALHVTASGVEVCNEHDDAAVTQYQTVSAFFRGKTVTALFRVTPGESGYDAVVI